MVFQKSKYLFLLFLISSFAAFSQGQPIGSWGSLMSYNSGLGVATDGKTMFCISKEGFFTVDLSKGQIIGYSKVNGMSDIGMQNIGYDEATSTAILVYANGNIDLFKDNTFTNIPDFKLKTVAGAKTVNQVYTENGFAYLSTTLGVLVININKGSISETYQFYAGSQLLSVSSFCGHNKYFYTITEKGLYRAAKNSLDLQNFQIWQRMDSTHNFLSIKTFNDKLILCDTDFVYVLESDTLRRVFETTGFSIRNLNPSEKSLFIGEYQPYNSIVQVVDTAFRLIDSFYFYDKVNQVVQMDNGSMWLSNEFAGLAKREDRKYRAYLVYYNPAGPAGVTAFDMYAHNNELYIAHGGHNDSYLGLGNRNGFSTFVNGEWKLYRRGEVYPYEPFGDTLNDMVTITKNERDGTIYAGSFEGGLFQLNKDGSYKIYKQNSILDPSGPNGPNMYQMVGSGFDANNNLWVTMFGSYHELYVKENETGTWYKFHMPYGRSYENSGGPLVFDDANHVWYVSSFGGGVIGYNTNNTISDETDDISYHVTTGVGLGNLPNGNVRCLAHDKSDNIWIGTSDGIAILYNASNCLSTGQRCDAEVPIVQYDKFAGYFFAGQTVNTIAVDGANRKWIGTDNGVWLLSPDAGNSTILYRFTTDNSPLPSNRIQKIAIDGVTGQVYIGTEAGLVSFKGTATEGGTKNESVITFPNPVPANYKGTIAIKGLVANADVRITDINGQLVYRTTALGGQAIWNGLDYKGRKPQSGVYLIFATNSDGTETYAGKMVFLQ